MAILKEVVFKPELGWRCIIRENAYGSNLDKFLKLYEEAKRDFPDLKPSDVEVVQFGGDRYKRTFGIEFTRPIECPIPFSYKKIDEVEFKL